MTREMYKKMTPFERGIYNKIHKDELITNDMDLSQIHEQDNLPSPLRDLSLEELQHIIEHKDFWLTVFPETILTKKKACL